MGTDPGRRASEFIQPAFMRHVIDNWAQKGSVLQIVVYAVPIAPGRCRLLNRQVFQFKAKVPRIIIGNLPKWVFHKQNNVILVCFPANSPTSSCVHPFNGPFSMDGNLTCPFCHTYPGRRCHLPAPPATRVRGKRRGPCVPTCPGLRLRLEWLECCTLLL